MVQVLEAPKSFGGQLGESLGRGLGSGAGQLLAGYLQNKKEQKQNERASDYFGKLAQAHPDDTYYQQLNELFSSPLPMDQKAKFAQEIMRSSSTDPFKQKQQQRLERDSLFRVYSQKIKEIDNLLKDPLASRNLSEEEMAQLNPMRQALIAERDALMGLDGSTRAEESEFFPDEEEEEEELSAKEPPAPPKKVAKPKFDRNNPAHIKRREEVIRKTKGDREKAGIVLSKEFEL